MSHMLSIGYGCYTPNIIEDMWATVIVLFVGCLLFALFLSQMISLIDQLNMGQKACFIFETFIITLIDNRLILKLLF